MTQTLGSSETTPLTPPQSDENRLSWLRLYRSRGVGVFTFFRLLREHGTAEAVLERLPDLAAQAGVRDYRAAPREAAEAEWRAARRAGARLICFSDAAYPAALAEIDEPPPLLWVKGDAAWLGRGAVAMVGARNASALGLRTARHLARGIGEMGQVVVSGLARGIDAAAHDAAIGTGTVAVLGGGVDVAYPAENAPLHRRIAEAGALVSEQPMGLPPQARHFPRRNRIIAGLAQALVVVEAAARSGSLITASNAADEGREVLAVPGHPFDGRAAGCNMLIRDGATLLRGPADIAAALGLPATSAAARAATSGSADAADDTRMPATTGRGRSRDDAGQAAPTPPATPPGPGTETGGPVRERRQASILERLSPSPIAEDHLARATGLRAAELAPILLDLEMDGRIARHPGGLVSRT